MTRKPSEFERHPTSYADALQSGRFRAWGKHVVDGDTFDLLMDLGLYQYAYERIRLHGIDTPEIYGVSHDSEEYAAGMEAKGLVEDLVLDQPMLIRTLEEESFGRFVARCWYREEGEWLDLTEKLRVEL